MRANRGRRPALTRRAALQSLGAAGVGAAGLALVGCGDGDETVSDRDGGPDRDGDEAAVAAGPEGMEAQDAGPAGTDEAGETMAPDQGDEEPAADTEGGAVAMPAAEAPAQGWREVVVVGTRPAARSNAVLALDEASGTLWLHGGRAGGQALSDLWAFDLASGAWREVSAADGPEARFAHVGVFDARGRLVVFGGQGAGASRFFSDVWAYDTRNGGWSLLADEGAGPVSRYGLGVGHDAAGDEMWISHGFTHQGRFDDTWVLELASGVWRDVSPTGERPVRRCLHACAYEPGSGVFALFGGQTNGVAQLGDTWLLMDGVWQQVEGAGPSARRFPTLSAVAGSFWMFGGVGADGPSAELWRLAGRGGGWEPADAAGGPGPRHSHAAAAGGGGWYLFGGDGAGGELNDLWSYTV